MRTRCPFQLPLSQPCRDHIRSQILLTICFRWVASLISLRFTEIKADWRPFTASFQEDGYKQQLAQSGQEPWATVTAREARASCSPSPFPRRVFTRPASCCSHECRSCDLHGKAAKVGMTWGWRAHLSHLETPGERGCSDLASHHLQGWSDLFTDRFSPLAKKMPFKDPTYPGWRFAIKPLDLPISLQH